MNKQIILFVCALCLCHRGTSAADPIAPIRSFIQSNFVGLPVIHAKQSWKFHPDVSLRRRKQFELLHGEKGERLIERLGLGIDGYEDGRLEKQRLRDEGHLGGLNYFNP